MKYNNRTEHEKKQDSIAHYDCLEADVLEEARKNFKRQPYQSVSVAQYMAKKYGIGGEHDGQKNTETISGTETGNQFD